ncbi:MAG: hypothetical protein IAI49_11575 [Candidatus Eremiobacteraeota bacterium]|nr:hypothetical protein [Candidatus Eremiobacteraeota bacterium]
MNINALGPGADTTPRGISSGYRRAIDGLRSFDELSASLHASRDAVMRGLVPAANAYPQPAAGSPAAAGAMIGSALAAFAGSESGRAAIEHAVSAAGTVLRGIFGAGPTQLPLPFE